MSRPRNPVVGVGKESEDVATPEAGGRRSGKGRSPHRQLEPNAAAERSAWRLEHLRTCPRSLMAPFALGSLGVESLLRHRSLSGALVVRDVYVAARSWEPWCRELFA